jgi:hypothetical protein
MQAKVVIISKRVVLEFTCDKCSRPIENVGDANLVWDIGETGKDDYEAVVMHKRCNENGEGAWAPLEDAVLNMVLRVGDRKARTISGALKRAGI